MRREYGKVMFSLGLVLFFLALLARLYGLTSASMTTDSLGLVFSGIVTVVGALEMRR